MNDSTNVPIRSTSPSSGAVRTARHRDRRRKRLKCVTIEIREAEIDVLIRRGWLSRDRRSDLVAVRQALHRFLDEGLR